MSQKKRTQTKEIPTFNDSCPCVGKCKCKDKDKKSINLNPISQAWAEYNKRN